MQGVSSHAYSNRQAFMCYQEERRRHWDSVACRQDHWSSRGAFYHERISEIYRYLVPPGQRVLEIGCGTGDLLASLQPTQGMGIDFSAEMIRRAKKKYPHLRFILCDAHEISLNGQFDVIILSDLVNDLWDVQA
ncbi:MAG TPA: class I SAM-dependent methyltransferase, partial [Desulfomonilia bacterium]|nr:class I SAM-dependent methyltransferase [Desulfomonilia bacterium]